jgi:hypothetical protein
MRAQLESARLQLGNKPEELAELLRVLGKLDEGLSKLSPYAQNLEPVQAVIKSRDELESKVRLTKEAVNTLVANFATADQLHIETIEAAEELLSIVNRIAFRFWAYFGNVAD